jgi:hypothetical protein
LAAKLWFALAKSSVEDNRNEDRRDTTAANFGEVGRNPLRLIGKSMAPLRIAPTFHDLRRIGNPKSGQ